MKSTGIRNRFSSKNSELTGSLSTNLGFNNKGMFKTFR